MDIITTLRQYRIGQFSIFDFAISYLGVYVISPIIIYFLKYLNIHTTRTALMWLVLPVSIITHIVIGKYTPLTLMFLDSGGHYTIKVIIVVMLYMAWRTS